MAFLKSLKAFYRLIVNDTFWRGLKFFGERISSNIPKKTRIESVCSILAGDLRNDRRARCAAVHIASVTPAAEAAAFIFLRSSFLLFSLLLPKLYFLAGGSSCRLLWDLDLSADACAVGADFDAGYYYCSATSEICGFWSSFFSSFWSYSAR